MASSEDSVEVADQPPCDNRRNYSTDTLRKLQTESSGICMMCMKVSLFDTDTDTAPWVGRITHIVGLSCTSARHLHDSEMSHEDRNGFDNLMLTCSSCAAKVDADEAHYTVEAMHAAKSAHSQRFGSARVMALLEGFADQTLSDEITLPDSANWTDHLAPDEQHQVLKGLAICGERLKQVPRSLRRLITIICERTADGAILTASTLEHAVGRTDGLHKEIGSLVSLGIIDVVNDDYPPEQIHLLDLSDRYVGDFWEQLYYACSECGVGVSTATEDLDLTVFDDYPPGIGYARI